MRQPDLFLNAPAVRRLLADARWPIGMAAETTGISRAHFAALLAGKRAVSHTMYRKILASSVFAAADPAVIFARRPQLPPEGS